MDRKKVTNNIIWRFLERVGAQGVTFVVTIILGRLLDPDTYGTVTLVLGFTVVLQVFVDSGLGSALIQKKDADDIDFSSVFFFNIFSCSIIYVLLFLCAPFIAAFYSRPELTSLVRVIGLTLIISGVKNIQQAYVARNLMFKRFFWSTLAGTIGAAIIGIIMAYKGFGVWALVIQHLFNTFIDTVVLWITVKWRPIWNFSFSRLKKLLSFGWKLLVSAVIDRVYTELRTFIIGKLYTPDELAFYDRGRQFPNAFITNINTAIDSVLLPSMSTAQDDSERVKAMTRRAIKTSTYVMAPLMMGLAACATPLIRFILTDKWLPCVFFLRIFCFTSMFYSIHSANLNAINAVGRSDLFLKLEVIKKIVGLIFLLSTVFISVKVMAIFGIVSSIIAQIINSWPNKKLLNYGYLEQLKDILPGILLAIIMAIIVYPVQYIGLPDLVILLIQVPLGVFIYVLGSKFFRLDSFEYLLDTVKSYFRKQ